MVNQVSQPGASILFYLGERERERETETERQRERENTRVGGGAKGKRERILSKLQAQCGARRRAQSHNPGLLT